MNHTIYFRKDVWEKFSEEENKSDLVNRLLATHYEPGAKLEFTKDDYVIVDAEDGSNLDKKEPAKPAKIEPHKSFFKDKKLNK